MSSASPLPYLEEDPQLCLLYPWQRRLWQKIKEGIQYPRKVEGHPHLGAHQCGRVSCSWNSKLHRCSDVQ
ncbi:hypothetical protein BDW72DRAFT_81017 [Aspergillus terricola var. indicus]